MITLTQALSDATRAGLERLDAQLLLLHLLGKAAHDRAWLLAHDGECLTPDQWQRYRLLTQRRQRGEPVAYLTGSKEFFGLALQVDARVLVPRPDTETLVEWALEVLTEAVSKRDAQGHESADALDKTAGADVMDLGTGSGAVALALQHARPELRVHASDISADALQVAQANAQRLGLPVVFRQTSWLQGVAGCYHAIVSNPPYIAAHDPHLAQLLHEPGLALTSGPDGLQDLRLIIAQAPKHLHPGGWLLLEHGYDQAKQVRGLLQDAGFAEIQSRQDLSGTERCSGGRWPRA